MRSVALYWLPVLVWMAIIFVLSTSRFSMAHTSRFILPMLKLLFRRFSEERLTLTHIRIRETAHFVEYLILSVLVFRALRAGEPERWQAHWMWLSVLITGAYGFADELHQRWESGRTARLKHALINLAGGITGQMVILILVAVAK